MSSFNVAQVIPSLHSGGAERGTLDVANYLAENKIYNSIISNGGKLLSELSTEYTDHCLLPMHSKNFFLYPILAKKIDKYIKNRQINIVHVRSRAPAWIIYFVNKSNITTLSTFHNVYGGNSILKKIYNKGLSKVDHIIAISEYVKNEIIKKYAINPDKLSVINRGIDISFFNKAISDNDIQILINKFNIDTTKKIVLFPGRLTSWKGQIEFLEVVKKIANKNIAIYFPGDTKNKSYTNLLQKRIYENKLENKCKILGDLNFNEMKILYSISHLVVSFPLRPEGFGRVISEALSMQKMVLAFNFGGVKDQLENLDEIFKVDPLNYENLENNINNILNLDEEKSFNITKFAKDYVQTNFSKNEMVKNYKELYESKSVQ